mmetsp:Transcript_11789/g.18151  ORF Transcript_11789/g.18151 Transcript_11789/m.18151 type:complete len:677 (-) Transcript_11789:448-2478(-)
MIPSCLVSLIVTASVNSILHHAPVAAVENTFTFYRPHPNSWKRTQCGSPSGTADIPSKWASQITAMSTPLPAYPRPQMVRHGNGLREDLTSLRDHHDSELGSVWTNLNGIWEWEPAVQTSPPFGRTLNTSILVPFPVESCLSGRVPSSSAMIIQKMWYRLTFNYNNKDDDHAQDGGSNRILLHFGAIDWRSVIYFNGQQLGNHTGGYDGFDLDITKFLFSNVTNELLVYVFDPSDLGAQPNGKQRISAIDSPGGDTYTPSSGIWQTVWMEIVPNTYIRDISINQVSTESVTVSAVVVSSSIAITTTIRFQVMDRAGNTIVTASGNPGQKVTIMIPAPQRRLWSPDDPYLYDLVITVGDDSVLAYVGLRTFDLGDGPKGKRPFLNGNFTFLAGFLDQSWWPDGQYTAPTDEALAFDVQVVPMFGLNMIRLHQKVNPERWYYHADKIGVIVFQDMPQKYTGASKATVPLFVKDFKAMIRGRGNHPCVVQYTIFNEGDCWKAFDNNTKPYYDVKSMVALAQQLDPTRLVDTDSGGGANNLYIGNVNDIHSYPYPRDPQPSSRQYAMIGEFGGIGAFVQGKEWKPNSCYAYLRVDTPKDEADAYVKMAAKIESWVDHVSASVYTQTTDVELECDGFLNYDRSNKFSVADTARIRLANQAIIKAAAAAQGVKTQKLWSEVS